MRLRASVVLFSTIGAFALCGCSTSNSIVESSTDNRAEYNFSEVTFTLAPEWSKYDDTDVNSDNYQIHDGDELVGFTFVGQSYIGNLADNTQATVDTWVDGVNKSGTLEIDNLTPIEGQGYTAYLASADVVSSDAVLKGRAKLLLSGGTIYTVIASADVDRYEDSEPEIDAIISSADIQYPMPLFDDSWLQELGMDDTATSEQQEQPQQSTTTIGAGTYRIGSDAPAGEYKVTGTSSDGTGYWEVNSSSSPDADRIGNDFFTGTSYVTVEEGQYLTLKDATAELVQ